ncbi:hypothetical protein C1H76_8671 [Elsinoe australis]|uniref:Uncharacterized protein n=1 Tax=Elsinoe australis TaxID=40998 RepID=A0A4U7AVQ2_9PEZI|nr:hypothetical protein C1H76_8671 [Elsinoe australis]
MASSKIPPRMSGSEVLGCVELVVGAFKEAADLVGRVSRKQKKRKGERNYHEILLFQVLEQGAKQIQQSYDEGSHRFGSAFRVGDDEARERLLCAAIETNADIVQSLQIACDIEKAALDLVHLHESAITIRHDAIRSLNDLHQRLEKVRPLGSFSRFSPDSSVCGGDTRRNSLLMNASELGSLPPAVTIPQLPEKSGLRRMLSVGGSPQHRRAKSDNPHELRPTSSQASIAPSVVTPAPLYFNNHPAYPLFSEATPRPVPQPVSHHARSKSTVSAEARKPTKAGTGKWEDTKDHPDLPDFQFMKKQKESSKHSRTHSNASSQPSKRDSVFSLPPRTSWDPPTPSPLSYPANLPPPPPPPVQRPATSSTTAATGIIPMTLVTSLPLAPHPAHRATIASPIPEHTADEFETSSVSSLDYDAASVYSQPEATSYPISSPSSPIDLDPGTPLTNPSSHSPTSDPTTPSTNGPSSMHARSFIRSTASTAPSSISLASPPPSVHCAPEPAPSIRSRASTYAPTFSSAGASTTISTLERQMQRSEDGTWHEIPREAFTTGLDKAREEQRMKARQKAERMYRPLHSASVSSGAPMSLQLGAAAVGLGLGEGHKRSRTLDSSVGVTAMPALGKTVSAGDKKEGKEKKGFWHIRKASREVVQGAKMEGKEERKERLRQKEKTIEWSSMAFAV